MYILLDAGSSSISFTFETEQVLSDWVGALQPLLQHKRLVPSMIGVAAAFSELLCSGRSCYGCYGSLQDGAHQIWRPHQFQLVDILLGQRFRDCEPWLRTCSFRLITEALGFRLWARGLRLLIGRNDLQEKKTFLRFWGILHSMSARGH